MERVPHVRLDVLRDRDAIPLMFLGCENETSFGWLVFDTAAPVCAGARAECQSQQRETAHDTKSVRDSLLGIRITSPRELLPDFCPRAEVRAGLTRRSVWPGAHLFHPA